MLRFAATTFDIMPQPGHCAGSLWAETVSEIYTALKTSIFLIEDHGRLIVIHTSHFITDYYSVSGLLRLHLASSLGIPIEQVFCFSSHNHCSTRLNAKDNKPFNPPSPEKLDPSEELTGDGLNLLRLSTEAAVRLHGELTPATLRYGVGKERRITHNRKGRRADGSTYLMREEDRLLLGQDFIGDIDDDAFVIGFFKEDGKAAGFLTQFTGHPVTAFHCDRPIVCAEFPQTACDDLSDAYGGVPVGFLQGCAGDTNSKGLLSDLSVEESVSRAENYGHQLGETFLTISRDLKDSNDQSLGWLWRTIHLPFKAVPPAAELKARLRCVEEFIARCQAGNTVETRTCDGLNFPSNLNPVSRINLVNPIAKWLKWAISFHEENRLHEAPHGLDLRLAVIRIGDVGIAGLPCEPFLGIGRQIKELSPLPMTVPCGYMNEGQDTWAYIPDSPNCEDLDYCSSFYRYTEVMLPFQKPAGDLLATAAVQMLEETLS